MSVVRCHHVRSHGATSKALEISLMMATLPVCTVRAEPVRVEVVLGRRKEAEGAAAVLAPLSCGGGLSTSSSNGENAVSVKFDATEEVTSSWGGDESTSYQVDKKTSQMLRPAATPAARAAEVAAAEAAAFEVAAEVAALAAVAEVTEGPVKVQVPKERIVDPEVLGAAVGSKEAAEALEAAEEWMSAASNAGEVAREGGEAAAPALGGTFGCEESVIDPRDELLAEVTMRPVIVGMKGSSGGGSI